MRVFLPALLLASSASAVEPFPTLDPRPVYATAANILPGCAVSGDPPAALPDPAPASWPVVDLGGSWKVSAHPDERLVDYQSIDAGYGPLRLTDVLAADFSCAGWRSAPVPWPESFRPGPDGRPQDFRGVVYYRRTVELPTYDSATQEPVLVFTAAGFRTDAWLGGVYLGHHLGTGVRFSFALGAVARPAATLPLVVKCVHTRFGMQWHGRLSVGITEPVRLEIRPRTAVVGLRTRITPDGSALEASFTIPGAGGTGRLVAEVAEASGGRVLARQESVIDARAPGFVRIPLAGARRWSPEDPFLHRLTLTLDGVEVGATRFGWRTIAIGAGADGKQRLLLNGQQLWMRGLGFTFVWSVLKNGAAFGLADQQVWGWDHRGRLREALLLMKAANINVLRPHSGHDFHSETFFNLCDELGFLVYLDWNGGQVQQVAGVDGLGNPWKDEYPALEGKNRDAKHLGELITALHNHPSLAFISFGNELYDWALPAGRSWDATIERLSRAAHDADWQSRPLSGSSGRPVWEHRAAVDFVDHHQYIGCYYGSWAALPAYLEETTAAMARRFGARLPFVTMETGDPIDSRIHRPNLERLDALLARPLDQTGKATVIKLLTSDDEYAGYLRGALHQGGIIPYIRNLPEHRRRKGAMLVKRYVELYRREHARTDGVALNTQFHSVAGWADPDFDGDWHGRRLQPWPQDGRLALADPFWDLRDGFAPVQALLDLGNPHPLCGATAAATLTVVNDREVAVDVAVRARLVAPDGCTAVELAGVEALHLEPGGTDVRSWSCPVPALWPSGTCRIELAVMAAGRRIAQNAYRLDVMAAADRRTSFPRRRLALYEGVTGRPAGVPSTGTILTTLGIPHQRIVGFDGLERFDVLVVGADAVDAAWLQAGPALHRWISEGGRLLAFEQNAAGGIPFAADERATKLGRSSFMEVWEKDHPVFAGLGDEMAWESPGGDGAAIFGTCLDLTDGFLALASVGHFADRNGVKAVVSNRRLGRGEYLLSMISTAARYGRDAVVTRYVENCLAYILGDAIAPQAVAAGDLRVRAGGTFSLDNTQAWYVDLRAAMNRGFEDEIAGDGLGGWSDHGRGNDLRALPRDFHRFDNLLPFWIVRPEGNGGNGCIVLRGPGREQFPAQAGPVAVGQALDRLYFLHTAMWVAAAPGDPLLTYDIAYSDGTTASVDMRLGTDLADWWKGSDLPNANIIYREGDRCLYASEWINPVPRTPIRSITMRSHGNAIPIVLAITGRKIFTQRVDRTE